jgi:DNA-binding transcriptional LysR family regulator
MLLPSEVPALRMKQLLMVLALAEHRSFGAASAALRTSQPSLTRAIQRIERVLGVRLFERDTRRVILTPAGREFAALAERAVNNMLMTSRSLSDVASTRRGSVTISTFSAFAVRDLPPIVAEFRKDRPDVEVRVREVYQPEIVEDVRGGVADFGIGFLDDLPQTVKGHLLATELLCVLVPPGHAFGSRHRPIRLEDLRGEPLVSLPETTSLRRRIDQAAATRNVSLRHDVVVERMLGVVNHVEAGVGLGILPSGALPPAPPSRCSVVALDPSLSVSVGIITARRRYVAPGAADMMAMVAQSLDRVAHLEEAK